MKGHKFKQGFIIDGKRKLKANHDMLCTLQRNREWGILIIFLKIYYFYYYN